MNERIKSLLAKAHLDVKEEFGIIDTNRVAEKFAELIVNKCANIVWDEAEKIDSHEVNAAGYKIIEHFSELKNDTFSNRI
jgi:hypothetical protein